MISYNANTDQYQVTFPGKSPIVIDGFEHDPHSYSISNGDWLSVLEKAYGQRIYNLKALTWGNTPYNYIDRANTNSTGVQILTGNSTDSDILWCTLDSTTRTKLIDAFANNKVVTAMTSGDAADMRARGFVAHHSYTVVAYKATSQAVRPYNPWGTNLVYKYGSDPKFFLGKDDGDNPTHAQNGYFWMTLSDFTATFGEITYEE